jgi:hypothetical protein
MTGIGGVFEPVLPVDGSQIGYNARENINDCEHDRKSHRQQHYSETGVSVDEFSDRYDVSCFDDIEEQNAGKYPPWISEDCLIGDQSRRKDQRTS